MKTTPTMSNTLFYCTSLAITDQDKNIYHGRTLEFSTSAIPSSICYYPKGTSFAPITKDHTSLMAFECKYAMLGMGMPVENNGKGLEKQLLEGVNSEGLSFSLNMKTNSELDAQVITDYSKVVSFDCLGHWALASFANVAQVKEAVKDQVFYCRELDEVGGMSAPFHFAFYDTKGECLVVEINFGKVCIYDNPTRVMTNGPELPWHLTNLNNYTHLTNLDVNQGSLGNMTIKQPDSGIALASLPSSDTSVDRFVRAAFYSSFAKQASSAQGALLELSHIMNKFDRPKNMSVSESDPKSPNGQIICEYTLWTSLTDLKNGRLLVRSYNSFNFVDHSISDFTSSTTPVYINLD
ncbi:linear amide C-N hydrolase [Myroides sp. LJL116]